MSKPEKLKIFVYTSDGFSRANACYDLAHVLAQRGHEIFFLLCPSFNKSLKKFPYEQSRRYQMKRRNRNEHDAATAVESSYLDVLKKLRESGLLSNKSPIEKLEIFDIKNEDSFGRMMYKEQKELHQQIFQAIRSEKPDFIIVDHFNLAPCITNGKTPWAFLFTGNPSFLFDSPDLPPMTSGYPSNDRTGWDEYREKLNKTFKKDIRYYYNKLNREFGYPEVDENQFSFRSPYINLYAYPEELDYIDMIPLPENFIRLDAYCCELPEPYEFPSEFKDKLKPGDKLVYISLGSIGSIDVDLMQRIVNVLTKTPHKFFISMGPLYYLYELGDNMFGQESLPQTKIIPIMDMVITHGGNNTVTETFSFGKPMLVMPLFADQYDNAQRIFEKGFGYRIDAYGFKDEELIETIDKILNDQEMIKRCQQAAERIRKTDNKVLACEKIEQILEKMLQDKKKI